MGKYFIFFFVSVNYLSAQNDSIIGKIKSIEEKVIYSDSILNNQVLDFEEDYGHFGFSTPELELSELTRVWYNTSFTSYANYVRNFNEIGQLIREEWFDKKDSHVRGFIYKYDDKNNLVQTLESYKGEGYLTINNYYYNYKNLLKSKIRVYIDSPDVYFYSLYYYDDHGNLIRSEHFQENGKSGGIKYEYDEKGRMIRSAEWLPYTYMFENGVWSPSCHEESLGNSLTIYKYDEFSNLIFEEGYKQMDDRNTYLPSGVNSYFYDSKNRTIKSCLKIFNPSTQELCTNFMYNQDNLLKEKDGYEEKIVYKYKNNLISEIVYERNLYDVWQKNKVDFKYKFDNYNNWIEQTKIVDGNPLYYRIRKIEYYD